jgi:M6 family metalloprotease-like protein
MFVLLHKVFPSLNYIWNYTLLNNVKILTPKTIFEANTALTQNSVQFQMLKNIITLITVSFLFAGCGGSNDGESLSSSLNGCNENIITATNPDKRPMLVVLVSYNDVQIDSSISTWNSKIFGKSEGELNHYYDEISHSQFEFSQATECNGVASVSLDKNHPNENIDNATFNANVYPDLKSALQQLDSKISYDVYDTNADGHITPDELLVTFIIAGYEDAYEGRHVIQGIWAHQSCVSSTDTPTLDGVTIMGCLNNGNFALFGEKHDRLEPHDATVGIIAHELGHSAFGLPDLYNTLSPNSGGIGAFGLMGYGTWTYEGTGEHAGETPAHMCAWSKYYNGWITPDETSGAKVMNATSLNSFNTLKININENEYYLLENRDNSGYDKGLNVINGEFDGGLAIWRINETKLTPQKISENTVNTDNSNKGVDLVEADSNYANIDSGGYGHEKNLFYDTNVNSFFNVTNIGSRSQSMTLNVN